MRRSPRVVLRVAGHAWSSRSLPHGRRRRPRHASPAGGDARFASAGSSSRRATSTSARRSPRTRRHACEARYATRDPSRGAHRASRRRGRATSSRCPVLRDSLVFARGISHRPTGRASTASSPSVSAPCTSRRRRLPPAARLDRRRARRVRSHRGGRRRRADVGRDRRERRARRRGRRRRRRRRDRTRASRCS